tara:strand:+ start:261 stop:392 length:132 start_codon:yes stop_codon:yes gene_type:complete
MLIMAMISIVVLISEHMISATMSDSQICIIQGCTVDRGDFEAE